ncbi:MULTISPECIES: phenylacetate--CoA ligase family protein [unclassified Streptomyces]|uniref:phenylacetate--CoA ligase family protein n=1 Tax=unclassified Streptomyces TaxID=2593676 RepID=UPI00278C0C95|nr:MULTISPECIES: phenylacetate--CoA ligase family protein [unclassified Streptomyces]
MWLPTSEKYRDFLDRYLPLHSSYAAGELTEEAWREWAREQLRRVVALTQEGSPFYAKHLAGVDPRSLTLDDLPGLPFTTKDDLRAARYDILSRDLDEACFFYETTGTTGPATPCPRDQREVIASNTQVTEGWRNIFADVFGDRAPRVGVMGPTEVHSLGDTLGDVARNVGSAVAKIWPYSPVIGFPKALQLMRDLALDVVFCTPNVALSLAKAALAEGLDPRRDFAVRVFLVTGEMCTPDLARQIDQAWGARTYNALYGAQESLVIASACARGRLHLARPNYIAELVDPDTGARLGAYGTGELVVTMLIDGIKPLIRYRTGDLVEIAPNDCGCGIQGPLVTVVGRTRDRLVLGERGFQAWEIERAVLDGIDGAYGYQVVIDRDGTGEDLLTVRLDLPGGPDPARQSAHAARVAARLGVRCRSEFLDDLDAITTTGAFVSWKAARIHDRRTADDHETAAARRLAGARGHRS